MESRFRIKADQTLENAKKSLEARLNEGNIEVGLQELEENKELDKKGAGIRSSIIKNVFSKYLLNAKNNDYLIQNIKSIFEKDELSNLIDKRDLADGICNSGNIDFIKEVLGNIVSNKENSSVSEAKNQNSISSKIPKDYFNIDQIVEMVGETKDSSYIISMMNILKKDSDFQLKGNNCLDLLKNVLEHTDSQNENRKYAIDYIKNLYKNSGKNKDYELVSDEMHFNIKDVSDIILKINDNGFIQDCIEDDRNILDDDDRMKFLIQIDDTDRLKKEISNLRDLSSRDTQSSVSDNSDKVWNLISSYSEKHGKDKTKELVVDVMKDNSFSLNKRKELAKRANENYENNSDSDRNFTLARNLFCKDVKEGISSKVDSERYADVIEQIDCLSQLESPIDMLKCMRAIESEFNDLKYVALKNRDSKLHVAKARFSNCIIKQIISSIKPDKIEKLMSALSENEIIDLAEDVDNRSYINSDLIKMVTLFTNDKDFISQVDKFMSNPDKDKILELDTKDVLDIINAETLNRDSKEVNLKKDITYGIEIESIGKWSNHLIDFFSSQNNNWHGKKDDTLSSKSDELYVGGVEVVSPVFGGNKITPDTQDKNSANYEIDDVCNVLKFMGNYTNESCGGHVHIGAEHLTSVDSYMNLLEIYCNSESVLYKICNEIGQKPRADVITYASPFSKRVSDFLKFDNNIEKINNLKNQDNGLFTFIEVLKKIQYVSEEEMNSRSDGENRNFNARQITDARRFWGINFSHTSGIKDSKQNTIEFRLANGSINSNHWIENINLFGGMIQVAEELHQINEKANNSIELDKKELDKLDSFNKLKNSNNEEEVLENLLKLVITDEKERAVYLEKYSTNKDIDVNMNNAINDRTEKVVFSANDVGKTAFSGENRVNGIEMQKADEWIQRDKEDLIKDSVIQSRR